MTHATMTPSSLSRVFALEVARVTTHLTPRAAVPVGVAVVGVLSTLYATFSREIPAPAGTSTALADPAVLGHVYLTGYAVGFVVAAILGAWVAVGGRDEGELLMGLLVSPSRARLAMAKGATALALGSLVGTVMLLVSVLVGAAFAVAGGASPSLGRASVLEPLLRAWLALPMWSLIGCGIGLILAGLTRTVVALLVWVFLVDVVLAGTLASLGLGTVAAGLPTNLSASIAGTAVGDGIGLLSPNAAVLVLALYGAVLWTIGAARLRWRYDGA